jgi:hypothetical protein
MWLALVTACGRAKPTGDIGFVPADFEIPLSFVHPKFRLSPITVADSQLDFDAVMASASMLRRQFGGAWPDDDFSELENRAELVIHERQFVNREAFVFSMKSPDESRVLGCVYIVPGDRPTFDAVVTFWVREDEPDIELPSVVRDQLQQWMKTQWPFGRVSWDGSE